MNTTIARSCALPFRVSYVLSVTPFFRAPRLLYSSLCLFFFIASHVNINTSSIVHFFFFFICVSFVSIDKLFTFMHVMYNRARKHPITKVRSSRIHRWWTAIDEQDMAIDLWFLQDAAHSLHTEIVLSFWVWTVGIFSQHEL